MAEATEQKGNAAESPSMEEILKSIRGVISGEEAAEEVKASEEDDDEEMLELTEMEIAEDEAPVSNDAGNSTTASSEVAEKSVLDDIDAALGADGATEKKEEPAVAEPEPVVSEAVAPVPEVALPEVKDMEEAMPANDVLEASADNNAKVGDVLGEDEVEPASESVEKVSAKNERLLKEKVADESSETLRSLVSNIPRTHVSSPYTKDGITLEELTIEAMRPFLAEWLNENLPTIVKQIVSKEIKKLIPQDDDK